MTHALLELTQPLVAHAQPLESSQTHGLLQSERLGCGWNWVLRRRAQATQVALLGRVRVVVVTLKASHETNLLSLRLVGRLGR